MSTVFDHVQAIIFDKSKTSIVSIDDEKEFSPFMTNRWISMYSPELANLINETTNRYSSVFEGKREMYDFFVGILPQVPPKRIGYIKKSTKEKKETDNTELIARAQQMSQREVKQLTEFVAYIDSSSKI